MTNAEFRRSSAEGRHASSFFIRALWCSIPHLALGLALPSLVLGDEAAAVDEAPITAADREHWSFRPLVRPAVPAVQDEAWPRNSVDRFVLSRLETAGLASLPEADRRTLIRRATCDLTGLPPTPEEVEAFVADDSPDAYERLVDRLLASDAYAARQAMFWLDLARFAETDGFEHDHVRPNAWRYRDWVIEAMASDMPYDEFVRLQIAGDVFRPDDPQAAIATGFLLCGPDMPDINRQEERRHNVLNELTATVGSVVLGLQVGCAQCHDHKYDPVSQLDFYRLRAFFENAEIFREQPIAGPDERREVERLREARAREWKRLEDALKALENSALERIRRERNDPKLVLERNRLVEQFTKEEHERRTALTEALEQVKRTKLPELPLGRVFQERNGRPEPSYLRIRGDFERRGPEVEPAFLRIASSPGVAPTATAVDGDVAVPRASLARWLTQPEHPLTARVMANRLWQQHFGRGLSTTPGDFGVVGDEPTHPELLDWLAAELVGATIDHRTSNIEHRTDSSGPQPSTRNSQPRWSLKRIHRLLVTSATYRQASRRSHEAWDEQTREVAAARWRRASTEDPENRLFWRMNRRRLEGEAIRDALLFVSDRLTQRRGGPGVRPPLPPELLVTLLKDQWPVTPDEVDHRRRSVYLFVRRNLRYPILSVFDQPDTNASCAVRGRSTTAPQALVLLNSELTLDCAQELAVQVAHDVGG
ncbi:MAG: DUF1549 and DUF1553 domain-containing protein, partial [Planctomycetes bacterium]|nr:DUF1549 and DUF1553 domain-containing protein [Planctomycetota bacterium]